MIVGAFLIAHLWPPKILGELQNRPTMAPIGLQIAPRRLRIDPKSGPRRLQYSQRWQQWACRSGPKLPPDSPQSVSKIPQNSTIPTARGSQSAFSFEPRPTDALPDCQLTGCSFLPVGISAIFFVFCLTSIAPVPQYIGKKGGCMRKVW